MSNKIPMTKRECRKNTIITEGDVSYIITRNKEPQKIIIDTADLSKVDMYSWSVHKNFDNPEVKHRWRDTEGKWHTVSMAHQLGFGRGWKHKNGNVLDFRKENMEKNTFYTHTKYYKASHPDQDCGTKNIFKKIKLFFKKLCTK